MSITPVPELERLLDEHAEAKVEFDKPLPRDEVEFYKREDRLLAAVGNVQKAATLDTLRALVAVARAAWVLADNIDTYCPCCDSHLEIVTEPLFDDATKVYAALAPLFPDEESGVVRDAQRGNGDEVRLGRLVERVYAGAERFIDEDGSTALRELYEAAKQPTDDEVDGFHCLADGHVHRNRYAEALCSARYQIAQLKAERDALLAEMESFVAWAESYPKSVWHEPNADALKAAHDALKAAGLDGIDALSAMLYRHALKNIGHRARAAIAAYDNAERVLRDADV